jgi:hypothetical protein
MTDNITVTNTIQNVTVTNTQPNVTISSVGAQGPAGSAGSVFYTYNQATPAATWTITHSLGGYPTATVIDSSGNNCEGTISYTNANTMVITFTSAFSGTAYIV